MASPVGLKDFSQLYFASNENFDARKYIIDKIGEENLLSFELWAFKANAPIQYDESARFLWNQVHRNCPLIGSLKSSIMRMVDYWQERFKDV
jgi:hypothetical protein